MKLFYLVLCLFIIGIVSSCESKKSPINELESLIEEINKDGDSYTSEQWDSVFDRHDRIMSHFDMYKGQYTKEESEHISQLHGQYVAIIAKVEVSKLTRPLKDLLAPIGSFFDGLQEGWEKGN